MFVEVQVDLIGWFEEVPFWRKLSSHRRCQSLLPFALRDLYIISYLLEFVKRFWKSFLSFFRRPSRSSRFRSWRDFYIISYLKPFVKWFFKISWNSFSTPLRTLYCFALAHSYNSIPYLPRFVKGFFEFFRNYFSSSVFYHIIFPIFRRCSRFIHIIRPPPSNN